MASTFYKVTDEAGKQYQAEVPDDRKDAFLAEAQQRKFKLNEFVPVTVQDSTGKQYRARVAPTHLPFWKPRAEKEGFNVQLPSGYVEPQPDAFKSKATVVAPVPVPPEAVKVNAAVAAKQPQAMSSVQAVPVSPAVAVASKTVNPVPTNAPASAAAVAEELIDSKVDSIDTLQANLTNAVTKSMGGDPFEKQATLDQQAIDGLPPIQEALKTAGPIAPVGAPVTTKPMQFAKDADLPSRLRLTKLTPEYLDSVADDQQRRFLRSMGPAGRMAAAFGEAGIPGIEVARDLPESPGQMAEEMFGSLLAFLGPTPGAGAATAGIKGTVALLPRLMAMKGTTVLSKLGLSALKGGTKGAGAGAVYGSLRALLDADTPKEAALDVINDAAGFATFGAILSPIATAMPYAFYRKWNWTPEIFKQKFPETARRVASNKGSEQDVAVVQEVYSYLNTAGRKPGQFVRGKEGLEVEVQEPRPWTLSSTVLNKLITPRQVRVGGLNPIVAPVNQALPAGQQPPSPGQGAVPPVVPPVATPPVPAPSPLQQVAQVVTAQAQKPMSRRNFLKLGGKVAAAAAVSPQSVVTDTLIKGVGTVNPEHLSLPVVVKGLLLNKMPQLSKAEHVVTVMVNAIKDNFMARVASDDGGDVYETAEYESFMEDMVSALKKDVGIDAQWESKLSETDAEKLNELLFEAANSVETLGTYMGDLPSVLKVLKKTKGVQDVSSLTELIEPYGTPPAISALDELTTTVSKIREVINAQAVPSNTGRPDPQGSVSQAGQIPSSGDVQQIAPAQPSGAEVRRETPSTPGSEEHVTLASTEDALTYGQSIKGKADKIVALENKLGELDAKAEELRIEAEDSGSDDLLQQYGDAATQAQFHREALDAAMSDAQPSAEPPATAVQKPTSPTVPGPVAPPAATPTPPAPGSVKADVPPRDDALFQQVTGAIDEGMRPTVNAIRTKFKVGATKAKRIMERLTAEGRIQKPIVQVESTLPVRPDEMPDLPSAKDRTPPPEPTADELMGKKVTDQGGTVRVTVEGDIDFSKSHGELPENFGEKGWTVTTLENGAHVATDPQGNEFALRGIMLYRPKGAPPLKSDIVAPSPIVDTEPGAPIFNSPALRKLEVVVPEQVMQILPTADTFGMATEDIADMVMVRHKLDKLPKTEQEVVRLELEAYVDFLRKDLLDSGDGNVRRDEFDFPDQIPVDLQVEPPVDPIYGSEIPRTANVQLTMSTAPAIPQGKPVDVRTVITALEDAMRTAGTPSGLFRTGRLKRSSARATFNSHSDIARLRSANDIAAATHETFHGLLKFLYGSPHIARSRAPFTGPMKREMLALGRALYGNKVPVGGYTSEGWAEFGRLLLTEDSLAATAAPQTYAWFQNTFSADQPEVFAKLGAARDLITRYRKQGAVARADAFVKEPNGVLKKVNKILSTFSWTNQIDSARPLEKLVMLYQKATGRQLPIEDDPYLTYSALRLSHHGRVKGMVEQGMLDLAGNVVGPSLEEVGAIVQNARIPGNKMDQFGKWLVALRAKEINEMVDKPGDPATGKAPTYKQSGMSTEDADFIIQSFDNPAFRLAQSKLNDWTKGLLNYAKQSGLLTQEEMDRMVAKSNYYIPFIRVYSESEISEMTHVMDQISAGSDSTQPSAFKGLKGSGRDIYSPFPALVDIATRIVKKSHEKVVVDQVVKMASVKGMGALVEEVPVTQLPIEFQLDRIVSQLKKLNIDPSVADLTSTLMLFTPARWPKGMDPILPVRTGGQTKWYRVPRDIYDAFMSNEVYRLPLIADLLVGLPARTLRLGTTAMRAAFALVTNPLRDVQTFLMQSNAEANPLTLLTSWFKSMGDLLHPTKHSEYFRAFQRLGGEMAQPLAIDMMHTKRTTKGLFRGKMYRVATNPIDFIRDLLQIPESATRTAELTNMAKDVGWTPGTPMTLPQSLAMLLASKRVTTDFSAAGQIGRAINATIPFYNASLQGTRTFFRTLKDRPTQAIVRGLVMFTIPTLLLWWKNKDKRWYRDMPYEERYRYWNIESGNQVIKIPRAYDWGSFFSTLPEALIDTAYKQDPESVNNSIGLILDNMSPIGTPGDPALPVPLKFAKEQLQNRIDFTGAKIVPEAEADLPPGEQVGPYTSKLAAFMGKMFPNQISPRRVDHYIRSFFGGLGPDVMDVTGLGKIKSDKEFEPNDLPVVGHLFRRGGKEGTRSLAVTKMYDEINAVTRAQALHRKNNTTETREEQYYRLALSDASDSIRFLHNVYSQTPSLEKRAKIQAEIVKIAEDVLASKGDLRKTLVSRRNAAIVLRQKEIQELIESRSSR